LIRDLLALAHDPSAWAALATLVVMELVLGVDNLVFIAILSNKLPPPASSHARRIGIGLSLIFRIMLVATAGFIVRLTAPVFSVMHHAFSWRDVILIAGGAFLVWKATTEIHEHVDEDEEEIHAADKTPSSFRSVVFQIVVIDIVFSIDSIITAVGMTEHVPIMIISVIAAVLGMLVAADALAHFIRKHPSIVMLALGFLLLIGTTLVADGFGFHFPKGYIYTAMAFAASVEALNILAQGDGAGEAHAAAPPEPYPKPGPAPLQGPLKEPLEDLKPAPRPSPPSLPAMTWRRRTLRLRAPRRGRP
jgi:predicted tellurium resistance membrane protein TerC